MQSRYAPVATISTPLVNYLDALDECRLLGTDPDEFIRALVAELTHTADPAAFAAAVSVALARVGGRQ